MDSVKGIAATFIRLLAIWRVRGTKKEQIHSLFFCLAVVQVLQSYGQMIFNISSISPSPLPPLSHSHPIPHILLNFPKLLI